MLVYQTVWMMINMMLSYVFFLFCFVGSMVNRLGCLGDWKQSGKLAIFDGDSPSTQLWLIDVNRL